MANAKIVSFVDYMTNKATAEQRDELRRALAPIIEIMTSLHAVSLSIKQRLDDLTERVDTLEQEGGTPEASGQETN